MLECERFCLFWKGLLWFVTPKEGQPIDECCFKRLCTSDFCTGPFGRGILSLVCSSCHACAQEGDVSVCAWQGVSSVV